MCADATDDCPHQDKQIPDAFSFNSMIDSNRLADGDFCSQHGTALSIIRLADYVTVKLRELALTRPDHQPRRKTVKMYNHFILSEFYLIE